jgi:hypothetical protein
MDALTVTSYDINDEVDEDDDDDDPDDVVVVPRWRRRRRKHFHNNNNNSSSSVRSRIVAGGCREPKRKRATTDSHKLTPALRRLPSHSLRRRRVRR